MLALGTEKIQVDVASDGKIANVRRDSLVILRDKEVAMSQKPSFFKYSYSAFVTLIGVAIVLAGGCRNCNRGCGYGYSPTIAPPATYSLQIPSANGNPAYYVPGSPNPTATANLPPHLVDPNGRAPTPINNHGGSSVNQQNGWRPTGGTNLSGVGPVGSGSIVAQPTSSRTQVASAPAARSVVTSVDYATTRVDDRLDATRLPATDASNVRAPAGYVNNGMGTRLAQVQPAPATMIPNTFNQPVTFTRPAPAVYNGQAVIAQQAPTQPFYYGTPVVRQSAPAVLAQSTATGAPSGGWTDREITASRSELNR